MSLLLELQTALSDVFLKNASGLLMVTAPGTPDAVSMATYSLRFESGQLSRARMPPFEGRDAVVALCKSIRIDQIRWFPLNGNPNWDGKVEVTRDDLADLVGLVKRWPATEGAGSSALRDSAKPKAVLDADARGKVLLDRAISVFANFYLGDVMSEIAAITKAYPPNTQPEAFINQCVQRIEPMVGEIEARKLLRG
jgi:hypothetical protein